MTPLNIQRCFLALVTLLVTACMSYWEFTSQQRFEKNLTARINWSIERYQSQEGVNFLWSNETGDGKVEYFYGYKTRALFDPAGSACRYVMIVDRSSQLIVGWRINGNPEYCRLN